MTSLGAAVIGLGIGEQHIYGYDCPPKCDVVALCDFSSEKLQSVAPQYTRARRTTDWQNVVDDRDVNVISIASFDDDHFPQTVAALEANKHVFVEKPLCRTHDELVQVKRLVADRGMMLGSNLVLRAAPVYRWLKQAIANDELGTVYAFDGDYLYGRIHKITGGWRNKMGEYSVMQGGAIHLADLMLWCTGQRPVDVTSHGNGICTEESSFEPDDFVSSIFRFPSGMIGRITANFGCVHCHHHVMRVFGTKATFIYDDQGPRIMRTRDPETPAEMLDLETLPNSKSVLIPGLLDDILNGADPVRRAQTEFDTMSICLAADESLDCNSTVEINYA